MSACVINANSPNYTFAEMNSNLIPTSLASMTEAQQTAYIYGDSAGAILLRKQVLTFLNKCKLSQGYKAQYKMMCPYLVPYATSITPQYINMYSMVLFLNGFTATDSGFSFICQQVLAYFKYQNTKSGCCS
jgi:hypothetical protein